jgi:hypothetical protein
VSSLRARSFLLAVVFTALATLFGVPGTAAAAPVPPAQAPELCSVEEWQKNMKACLDRLADVSEQRAQCLTAPTPSTPDSGLGGWFASRPTLSPNNAVAGYYSEYGYAGYSYTTYDIGCVSTLMHPDYKFENSIANGEFMIATAIVGASNALRERAWNPQSMWGWADPLVEKATRAIYQKVFTVFGVVTLAVVGLYLLWRSRQSDMSGTMTTAGWALLVMVAVTAIATWPVTSANLADNTLTMTLGVVHDAVGPPAKTPDPSRCLEPTKCADSRPPAIRASDTATESMLYRNWLRGTLGSADSETAQKYGPALYSAKSLTWGEAQHLRNKPADRDGVFNEKSRQWMKVAEQIKNEDPEAYEYLRGTQGWERVGAGFIAILASLFFALFDIIASILVLLGFLIFRWAVIAAPILGTVGLLRPASAGIRRLANAVVAAIFNIAIFGTGAAVYLFAVDLIMSTPSLPGWLQVVLVALCGLVGWLLLRPYTRITQLGGKGNAANPWRRRFLGDPQETRVTVVTEDGTAERTRTKDRATLRPEARSEDGGGRSSDVDSPPPVPPAGGRPHAPPTRHWEPQPVPDGPRMYTIYRPDTGDVTVPAQSLRPPVRAETR